MTEQGPRVGEWGSRNGMPLHLPSYRIGYEDAHAHRDAAEQRIEDEEREQ